MDTSGLVWKVFEGGTDNIYSRIWYWGGYKGKRLLIESRKKCVCMIVGSLYFNTIVYIVSPTEMLLFVY
jgi:hypothetical protein